MIKEAEEFKHCFDEFISAVAGALGIYKLLDVLTKWLDSGGNNMKQLRIKKEPEIIYLPSSKDVYSTSFDWLGFILFILVCCLSTCCIFLILGIHP